MLAIIAVHCTNAYLIFTSASPQVYVAITTIFKFGTIGFFLISGFLLGERVDRRNPFEYFGRRLKRVFLPWLFWLGMLSTAYLIREFTKYGVAHAAAGQIVRAAYETTWNTMLGSAFWFVPNLLFSIAILLACRRYLYTLKLGALLLAANLVYVANIYTLWFPPQHNSALFGFVFYLWLGSYAAHHFDRLSALLARISAATLVAMSVATCLLAYGESELLVALHNPEPLNTLRASNQIFSICMVLLFFKFTRAAWPRFIDVRRHTFGLYLSHTIVLELCMHFIKNLRPYAAGLPQWLASVEGVGLWAALTLTVYLCCLGITAWLARTPSLQWMVGLSAQDSPRKTTPGILETQALIQT
jgi:membrane-bound acyltransferase YfiQ involved in biofilm formation